MIDLILLAFCFGVFYFGFWAGNKYGTLTNMKDKIIEKFSTNK
jgi:hypothetical protein